MRHSSLYIENARHVITHFLRLVFQKAMNKGLLIVSSKTNFKNWLIKKKRKGFFSKLVNIIRSVSDLFIVNLM